VSSYSQDPVDQQQQQPGLPPPPPTGQPWNQQGYGGQQGHPGQPGYTGYPAGQPGGMAPVSSAGRRFGAFLLDGLLAIVTLGIGWLIWSLVLWSKGQSPGKSLLGMRCIRSDTGQVATWGTMALRELVGKYILGNITFGITTLVSAVMILIDNERHEGIWDKIASTVVVDDRDNRLVA